LNKKFAIYLPILFALVLVTGIFLGHKISPVSTNPTILGLNMNKYNKLDDVVNYILEEYVDSVDRNNISEQGINGILDNLDPHSQYITAEDYNAVNEPLLGNFEGIGIQFRIEKDTIAVIQTIPGGPSEKVGLLAGDRLVYVDDSLVAGVGIDNDGAMKRLKGKRGTKVDVGIFRRGLSDLLNFEITRDVIPTFSIDIAFMPEDELGYIKVSKFSATTKEEFQEAADKLLDEGMQKLILDLRGNTGGYLQAAIAMADEFLEKDKLIVYTEGNNQPKETFYARRSGKLENTEVAVLIDGVTASASEIVAGALQDNDRGTIIGRRSYGKGLVQRQLDLLDGSALRLTIARYYTPTGRCIQKPYKRENGFEEYYSESYHRYMNGEMEDADSIPVNDSLEYTTPGGKTVYGGGGIMPDIYVPLSTDDDLNYFNELVRKGLIFRFAFEYTDKNRKDLLKYENFEDFNKQFDTGSVLFAEFVEFATENGVDQIELITALSEKHIKYRMKAFISRNLFDNKGFYPVLLQTDDVFEKAVEILFEESTS